MCIFSSEKNKKSRIFSLFFDPKSTNYFSHALNSNSSCAPHPNPPHQTPCRLSSLTTAFASSFSDKVNWVVLHSTAAGTQVSWRVLRKLWDKWPTNERLGRLDIFNWLFKHNFHPASRITVAQLQLDAWCSKPLIGHEGSSAFPLWQGLCRYIWKKKLLWTASSHQQVEQRKV